MNLLIDALIQVLRPIGITEPVFQFMLVSAILGLSVYLTLYTGMLSLANAGFMAIGAYVSVVLTTQFDVPLGIAMLIAMTVCALVAIPIGLPTLRLKDIYLAIATIGFGEVIRIIALNFDKMVESILELFSNGERVRFELLNGARGIKNVPQLTETWMLIIFLIVAVFLIIRLHHSRFGRAMSAVRQDERAASNLGINVVYVKNMVFILSAILAGAAGAFNGHLTRIIVPNAFDFAKTVDILAYAVLGGTSTWLGPIVGGMVLTALPEILRFSSQYRGVVTGAILLGTILFLPGGLVNPKGLQQVWRRYVKREPALTAAEEDPVDA
ncbi:branched-chain amino acid ABC transporter permease [Phototrophicus methaneseepsis]|uniref:Branched-chain amino acid ABC transporter permease n=1 Tax=Phototrophicus methaneseepsis TaxID=2710758 RepID=A0A7S8EBN1_9CHLR|nr:branched-chain amino acid ABC transporter permease [Phototrophicus methaneseepsis]QPC83949.1 branched-chain amino acid ABC transporter permease [Phototrophicus methaneseepsis]